ncbi:MAG: carboxypeptidase-like regulatory domain-containing protein, partial [Bacteroidales bacterium]|nr:carboxypeptidase-like regulatory domain-containing protein [Bacteroidales bacterium]
MRNFTLFIFLLLFVHQILPAQTGTLRGKIIDAKTGEELIGATVVVTGTVKGTISDFDGNFSLPLEPGTHNITISYISYETLNFPGVEIKDGEVTLLNVNLGEASVALEEVKVVARSRQRTEAALQILQKKSAMVLDGISAQQIT